MARRSIPASARARPGASAYEKKGPNLGDEGADGAPPTPLPKMDGARFSKCELDSPDCRKLRISFERCLWQSEETSKAVET